ncbi:MAG: Phosphatidylserine decarboxylase [Ignavibacteriae bacterium]|nr:MAG: Phosphatidylserine decarboxylase [Ignavibacteriota bacterium]
MLTKYGIDVLIIVFVFTIILILVSYFFVKPQFLKYLIISISLIFLIFSLYFFRDPERKTPDNTDYIIAPADGKIIAIKEVYEDEFLKSDAIMLSIFMSPLNVHVNRFPINGKVEYFKHIDGKHLVAFADKSSELNERTLIGIEGKNGKVFFKQIAGIIARRIVADVEVGSYVKAGDRFGMIKFGSRVDIFIPKVNVSVLVKLGDKTYAGETILAKFLQKEKI